MDSSSPGCSVGGILQARTLEWVAIPFSRGSSQGSNSHLLHCRWILYHLSQLIVCGPHISRRSLWWETIGCLQKWGCWEEDWGESSSVGFSPGAPVEREAQSSGRLHVTHGLRGQDRVNQVAQGFIIATHPLSTCPRIWSTCDKGYITCRLQFFIGFCRRLS